MGLSHYDSVLVPATINFTNSRLYSKPLGNKLKKWESMQYIVYLCTGRDVTVSTNDS